MSPHKSIGFALILLFCAGALHGALDPLKPGDTISVNVVGEDEFNRSYVLDEAGEVDLPLVGRVLLSGKTAEQARDFVAERLKQYIREPDVRLELVRAAGTRITISGAGVKSPGTFEASGEIGLRDSLSVAGGALPTADLAQVTVVRGGEIIKADLARILANPDPSADIKLQDGDIVNVPSKVVGTFTILGAVREVGTYPLLRGMKVLDAVKAAGGPAEMTRVKIVKIVRADGTTEEADLNKLLYGEVAQNKLILPDDTVVLESEQEGPGFYSVLGAVYKPGRFELTQKLTVAEALAASGGPTPTAELEKCALSKRKADGTFELVALNFKDILNGSPEGNMVIQDGDVLNVPDRGAKKPGVWERLPALSPLLWLLL